MILVPVEAERNIKIATERICNDAQVINNQDPERFLTVRGFVYPHKSVFLPNERKEVRPPYTQIYGKNMKRICSYSLLMALLWLASACQSIQPLSIDYMKPAEVSFPASLKRVGVVNNMPSTPETHRMPADADPPKDELEIRRKTEYYLGNAQLATESLAESLAAENYFDEVIICDSALRAQDRIPRESTLSREEVNTLADNLGVDFLIALENVQVRSLRRVSFLPDIQAYYETTDVKVFPTFSIYLPDRQGPVTTIQSTDSIFWEEAGSSEGEVQARSIQKDELIEAASQFAGTTPIRYLLPHWQTARRYLFTGGSVDMRDAAVYVREGNWPDAIGLWKRHYEQKKGKQKLYAACNIALGYEMQDSIAAATEWAEKAVDVARQQAEKTESENDLSYYMFTYDYWQELSERLQGIVRLNAQMERFEQEKE